MSFRCVPTRTSPRTTCWASGRWRRCSPASPPAGTAPAWSRPAPTTARSRSRPSRGVSSPAPAARSPSCWPARCPTTCSCSLTPQCASSPSNRSASINCARRRTEELAAAERELKSLHWWKRGRRLELETQVTRHRSELRRADEKHEQLRQHAERRSQFLALARERDELAPSLRPEPPRPRLGREPPGLGLEW